ncbi:MAG: T9SS type A sorting domain-containing protein [Bacteroidales bacterium]|nr:T9SS type A sorting domain-containing protein [Bacteroidales bacterium]
MNPCSHAKIIFASLIFSLLFLFSTPALPIGHVFIIDQSAPVIVPVTYFTPAPGGGDTIKILSSRTQSLKFNDLTGDSEHPIVIINSGGQVDIASTTTWGALSFVNCRYIKVSGRGAPQFHFGFRLSALSCGLAFAEYSSDCEAENIEIHHTSFFGIFAKKDFSGFPPVPYPIFSNLVIHDMYIHHVEEGMYIGETKSPGMEFRHVRIYNNVVTDCLREAIQVANCVEDVEVYNNFCAYTGLGGLYAQSNVFQIGGNTIGRYYNNIFMHAPENGVICMGSGDVDVFNNYISDNDGIYCDNREFNIANSSISFNHNFIRNTNGAEVILNANQLNDIHIRDNKYNTALPFARASKPYPIVWDTLGNQFTTMDSLLYSVQNGLFILESGNPVVYSGLGPIAGLGHQMNGTPIIDTIGPIIVPYGDTLSLPIHATTPDNDLLSFEVINLPSFASFTPTTNGHGLLQLVSSASNKGVYFPTIRVRDSSNSQYARETFKLAIKDTANHNPTLSLTSSITMEAASKFLLDITATDADNDPISYSFVNLPGFTRFISGTNGAWLDFKPLLADEGNFTFTVIADDGYGRPDSAIIALLVTPVELIPGRVLYRVNCSGPELEDQPINWQFDNGIDPVYGTSFSYGTGSHSWNGTNQTGAPNNLFGPYRHYGPSPKTMAWNYPVPSRGTYRVNLYFSERSLEVNNNTTGIFDIKIEDSIYFHSFNIYNEAGFAACKKQSDVLVVDEGIDILFTPLQNDAKVNGFEIILLEAANNPPVLGVIEPVEMPEGQSLLIPLSIQDDAFPGCDSLSVTIQNAPQFIDIIETNNSFALSFHPDYNASGNYQGISVVLSDGCLSVTQTFSVKVNDVFINTPPILNPLTPISITEGENLNYGIIASDIDNQSLTISYSTLPVFVQYQPGSNGHGTFVVHPAYSDAGIYSILVTVTDTYGSTDKDTLEIEVLNAPEVQRIILNSSMITDLVRPPYGSSVSPNYLVDEQSLNPVLNQHPVSQSWKPYHNLTFAPYHVYFNLGEEYVIKKIYFHDMHNVANLEVAYGNPSQWTYLFTEPCNAFTSWKYHETNFSSQYIRLTMSASVYAAVNEIAIFGYPSSEKKTAVDQEVTQNNLVRVYPNPCNQLLNISTESNEISSEFYSLSGQLLQKCRGKQISTTLLNDGFYFLIIKKENGELIHKQKIMVTH